MHYQGTISRISVLRLRMRNGSYIFLWGCSRAESTLLQPFIGLFYQPWMTVTVEQLVE
jgi:hypothetical protein